MTRKDSKSCLCGKNECGFTIIEVMISMIVMVVGLVSLLAVMGIAMASTQSSEQNAIAKRLANEAMESILTARETDAVQWSMIANGNCAVGPVVPPESFFRVPNKSICPGWTASLAPPTMLLRAPKSWSSPVPLEFTQGLALLTRVCS